MMPLEFVLKLLTGCFVVSLTSNSGGGGAFLTEVKVQNISKIYLNDQN